MKNDTSNATPPPMKKRPDGFLVADTMPAEVFSYIVELHDYFWRVVRAVRPGAGGDLAHFIPGVVAELERRSETRPNETTCPAKMFGEWWGEQTLKGDPMHRPHLVEDAFMAGMAAIRSAPSATRRSETRIAEDAINLFIEYRDKHGHDEQSARASAINEFAESGL